MIKLRFENDLDRVPQLAFAKSYGFTIRGKLGGGRANFKNTFEESPSAKSCSTSQFSREISCKFFSLTKF